MTLSLRDRVKAFGPSTYEKASLPPLKKGSESPNSNKENAIVEFQKTRSELMDRIHAGLNSFNRNVNRIDSIIEIMQRELRQKMNNCERQSLYNKRQVQSITDQLQQIENQLITQIKNSVDTEKLQFEQQLKHDTLSRFTSPTEEQNIQNNKLQQLQESIVSFLSKNSELIKEIHSRTEDLDSRAQRQVKNQSNIFNSFYPKMSVYESSVNNLEITAEEFVNLATDLRNIDDQAKVLVDNIRNVEEDFLPKCIEELSSQRLQSISNSTNAFEQRIFGAYSMLKQSYDRMELFREHQKQIEEQIQTMAGKSMELEGLINLNGETLTAKLNEIENTLIDVKATLLDKINERSRRSKNDTGNKNDVFNLNVNHISKYAGLDIEQLSGDWSNFVNDNNKAQNDVDNSCKSLHTICNHDSEIVRRVKNAEEKVKWIVKRLSHWSKDDARRIRLGIDNMAQVLERVEELEQNFKQLEERTEEITGEKFEKKEIEKRDLLGDIERKPEVDFSERRIDPLVLDRSLKLTYLPEDEFIPLKDYKHVDSTKKHRHDREKKRKPNKDKPDVDSLENGSPQRFGQNSVSGDMGSHRSSSINGSDDEDPLSRSLSGKKGPRNEDNIEKEITHTPRHNDSPSNRKLVNSDESQGSESSYEEEE